MKLIAIAACFVLTGADLAAAHEVSAERLTPIVLAVRKARVSVVSIKGQKTVTEPAEPGNAADATEARRSALTCHASEGRVAAKGPRFRSEWL